MELPPSGWSQTSTSSSNIATLRPGATMQYPALTSSPSSTKTALSADCSPGIVRTHKKNVGSEPRTTCPLELHADEKTLSVPHLPILTYLRTNHANSADWRSEWLVQEPHQFASSIGNPTNQRRLPPCSDASPDTSTLESASPSYCQIVPTG